MTRQSRNYVRICILFALFIVAQTGVASRATGTVSVSSNEVTRLADGPNTFNVDAKLSGEIVLYVIRNCTEGAEWYQKNGGVIFHAPFVVPNPGCTMISYGTPSALKPSYTVAIPDILSLYGMYSLGYTVFFEADILVSGKKRRVLLDSKSFRVNVN